MDNEQVWAVYFAGLLALRFHPKNVEASTIGGQIATLTEDEYREIDLAAQVADEALKEHRSRYPCRG